MLPKKNRLDKKAVDRIFKEGKSFNSSVFNFKFIKHSSSLSVGIAVIVPKSVAKLAVRRNSLRRKGYMVVAKEFSGLPPGLSGIFVFKKYEDNLSKIENEIKNLVSLANKSN